MRRARRRARRVDADACFVFIGASPRTDWLDGRARARRARLHPRRARRRRPTAGRWRASRTLLETSVPGVFVAGDVRARSIKRVASAVGEGSMAVSLIHEYLVERMSRVVATRHSWRSCARSTCSTSSTTSSSPSGSRVARSRRLRARRDHRRAGRGDAWRAAAARRARAGDRSSTTAASSRRPTTQAPTWMGAIAALTGGAARRAHAGRDRLSRRRDRARRVSPAGLRPAGRSTDA